MLPLLFALLASSPDDKLGEPSPKPREAASGLPAIYEITVPLPCTRRHVDDDPKTVRASICSSACACLRPGDCGTPGCPCRAAKPAARPLTMTDKWGKTWSEGTLGRDNLERWIRWRNSQQADWSVAPAAPVRSSPAIFTCPNGRCPR